LQLTKFKLGLRSVSPIAERIAVIGAGRIGRAIIKALVSSGYRNVVATGRSESTLHEAETLGARSLRSNSEAVSRADLVILSVKPFHLPQVLVEVERELWKGKVVVSIMAGVRIETLKKHMPEAEVYRAMPNICSLVGRSSTAIADGTKPGERMELVERVFSTLGKVYWVQEELLDAWTGLVGSGPAYIAEVIDGLVLGGLAVGMPRELALASVLDVLEGTVEFLRKQGMHPSQMRDEVITPRGTTIVGIKVLEKRALKSALIEAVVKATRRATGISKALNATLERLTEK